MLNKILDTNDEIKNMIERSLQKAKGFYKTEDLGDTEFTVVQPYRNGEAIVFKVFEEEGERKVNVNVVNTFFLLEKIEGNLDIYEVDENVEEEVK
ncbi:hypothetical protein KZA78_001281 [Listeria monocytogenes]|nr:hypothetical protein [Listeria monocytogenes]